MSELEPVGMFPGMTLLWRQCHNQTPLVDIRCGAQVRKGKRRRKTCECREEVGSAWRTGRGLLVRLDQTLPGRRMRIPLVGAMNDIQLAERQAQRDAKFVPGSMSEETQTGHSKRLPRAPFLITLDINTRAADFADILVACPIDGALKFDLDGVRSVCELAMRDQRDSPRTVLLAQRENI